MDIVPLSPYSHTFPDPKNASNEGIVAYGGDLNINRIMKGYSLGIFPWFKENDPILWWSPNPRFVLDINEFKIPKSLQRTIKKNCFEIKFDTNFKQVIENCANIKREAQEGTWITNSMINAYCELHDVGFAHSFESYYDDELVGGGYGVVIGDIFCGESMFSKKSDASKVAFVELVKRLKCNGFRFIDSQIYTKHLASFGAKEISRDEYLSLVKNALNNPKLF
jgi:leucyl/phenylalanyl-tRNA--protein transferase